MLYQLKINYLEWHFFFLDLVRNALLHKIPGYDAVLDFFFFSTVISTVIKE